MTQINNVEDPAAVIAVPTEKDLDCIKGIIQSNYDEIRYEYELRGPNVTDRVVRRGSLCQEVLAQLHDQMEDE